MKKCSLVCNGYEMNLNTPPDIIEERESNDTEQEFDEYEEPEEVCEVGNSGQEQENEASGSVSSTKKCAKHFTNRKNRAVSERYAMERDTHQTDIVEMA
ncbi:hypothetical protein HHI36_000483 [Cryptolaemus montrouzieri]|uniref:Uncharacterized protein n=1 Tax=Cryptolaemus montrouzieri TaxID=559131 RepID=A0ABD2P586_9CUCU